MGPTASGKTDLAVNLTRELPCEIISVDSALVYRGMDIGTAKPDVETQARVPHRLIDLCDPTESYSAARFRMDALAAMVEITASSRIPLLVGGTMMYFRALEFGLSELPSANAAVRRRLDADAAARGVGDLHRRLISIDPEAAARIHPHDRQRIQRALEVYELSGKTISQLQSRDGKPTLPYQVVKLARAPRWRGELHRRIESRFRGMLEKGFEQEVRLLLSRYLLAPGMPSMRTVGYRQMLNYVSGEYTWEQMLEKGIVATRQLAKRQLTWLRGEKEVCWLDEEAGDVTGQALKIIKQALKLDY